MNDANTANFKRYRQFQLIANYYIDYLCIPLLKTDNIPGVGDTTCVVILWGEIYSGDIKAPRLTGVKLEYAG